MTAPASPPRTARRSETESSWSAIRKLRSRPACSAFTRRNHAPKAWNVRTITSSARGTRAATRSRKPSKSSTRLMKVTESGSVSVTMN